MQYEQYFREVEKQNGEKEATGYIGVPALEKQGAVSNPGKVESRPSTAVEVAPRAVPTSAPAVNRSGRTVVARG